MTARDAAGHRGAQLRGMMGQGAGGADHAAAVAEGDGRLIWGARWRAFVLLLWVVLQQACGRRALIFLRVVWRMTIGEWGLQIAKALGWHDKRRVTNQM